MPGLEAQLASDWLIPGCGGRSSQSWGAGDTGIERERVRESILCVGGDRAGETKYMYARRGWRGRDKENKRDEIGADKGGVYNVHETKVRVCV